jgi:hypothetical protein
MLVALGEGRELDDLGDLASDELTEIVGPITWMKQPPMM